MNQEEAVIELFACLERLQACARALGLDKTPCAGTFWTDAPTCTTPMDWFQRPHYKAPNGSELCRGCHAKMLRSERKEKKRLKKDEEEEEDE